MWIQTSDDFEECVYTWFNLALCTQIFVLSDGVGYSVQAFILGKDDSFILKTFDENSLDKAIAYAEKLIEKMNKANGYKD